MENKTIDTINTETVVADAENSKSEVASKAKGENNMKNETTTTTILNSNNPFAKTLAKEAEAKAAADKAKAEKDAAEAAQKALEDSEKKYADVADYDLVAAAKAMSEKKGMIEVKIAGVTIGYASSEEDAEKMRVELHHYGKDLTSPEKVTMALAKQSAICAKAAELVEAGFVPERTIEVDGKKYLVNSKRAYTMEGHMVASLEDCGDVVLPVAIQDELYGKRIRETVAKEQPKVVNEPRPAAPKARKPRKIATDRVVSVTIQRQYGNLSLEEAVGQAILEQADKLRYDASHNSNWYNTKPITRPQASAFAQRICDRIVTESPIEGDSIDDLYNQISNLIFDVCAHDDAVGMVSPSVGRDIANTVADVIINNSEIE